MDKMVVGMLLAAMMITRAGKENQNKNYNNNKCPRCYSIQLVECGIDTERISSGRC